MDLRTKNWWLWSMCACILNRTFCTINSRLCAKLSINTSNPTMYKIFYLNSITVSRLYQFILNWQLAYCKNGSHTRPLHQLYKARSTQQMFLANFLRCTKSSNNWTFQPDRCLLKTSESMQSWSENLTIVFDGWFCIRVCSIKIFIIFLLHFSRS